MSITDAPLLLYAMMVALHENRLDRIMEPQQPSQSLATPIAIIAGFGMIAAAIYFSGIGSTPAPAQVAQQPAAERAQPTEDAQVRPIDNTDYVRGNPNAPIVFIEYSDYDCPFCARFHTTMKQIMDEYGVTGRVAWVYRQMPLPQLHPNAPRVSEAALCVGDVGGNDAFWTFSDLIFARRTMNEPTNVTRLPDYAEEAGVPLDAYIECMESGRMQQRVTDSAAEAFEAGARGTPHTFVTIGDQQAVVNGAQPYEVVKGIVENLLGQLDGEIDPATGEPAGSDTPEA